MTEDPYRYFARRVCWKGTLPCLKTSNLEEIRRFFHPKAVLDHERIKRDYVFRVADKYPNRQGGITTRYWIVHRKRAAAMACLPPRQPRKPYSDVERAEIVRLLTSDPPWTFAAIATKLGRSYYSIKSFIDRNGYTREVLGTGFAQPVPPTCSTTCSTPDSPLKTGQKSGAWNSGTVESL